MLTEKETTRISKFLSLVLRHKPEEIDLELDNNGWADVNALIEKCNRKGIALNFDILKYVVDTNAKKRFAFNVQQNKIRPSQGHSIDVDLGLAPKTPPAILYHGTSDRSANAILEKGLIKQQRQHVHLSADVETATKVGQRHGKPFLFEVLAAQMHKDGYQFFLSENGVWLTDHVLPQYLRQYEANNRQLTE